MFLYIFVIVFCFFVLLSPVENLKLHKLNSFFNKHGFAGSETTVDVLLVFLH